MVFNTEPDESGAPKRERALEDYVDIRAIHPAFGQAECAVLGCDRHHWALKSAIETTGGSVLCPPHAPDTSHLTRSVTVRL